MILCGWELHQGILACDSEVVRLSAKYGNLSTLEDGYGINLLPLATFAMKTYKDDDCKCFKISSKRGYSNKSDLMMEQMMHKAITIIQFKLEGQIIKDRPEFAMESRLLLDKINFKKGTVKIDGKNL